MTGAGETTGARLLLAEDEPMIGRILEHKLTREGHAVTWVRSAADAERVLRDGVEVALVDVTLERDGIDLVAAAVAAGHAPAAGWLAMVEARDASALPRALAAGAAGVVMKPFKPTAVAAQVAALVAANPV